MKTNSLNQTLAALAATKRFTAFDLQFARFLAEAETEGLEAPAAIFGALVSEQLAAGNVCIDLFRFAERPIESDPDEAGITMAPAGRAAAENFLTRSRLIARFEEKGKPLFYDGKRLYLAKFRQYEAATLEAVKHFLAPGKIFSFNPQLEEALFPLSGSDSAVIAQNRAVRQALVYRFSLISGGPGTGKTTTVAKILYLHLSANPELKIALAAPTGKAAARMNEALVPALDRIAQELAAQNLPFNAEAAAVIRSQKGETLHRLLGLGYSRINKAPKLLHDLLVIDESSMMSMALVARLFGALKKGASLIMLGDKDQLVSVEAGSFFSDICGALANSPVRVALSKYWRFEKGIQELAGAVNNALPLTEACFTEIVKRNPQTISHQAIANQQELKKALTPLILNHFGALIPLSRKEDPSLLEALSRFRLLCVMRSGPFGVEAITRMVEEILRENHILIDTAEYYAGRPVMVIENSYAVKLYNGDTGIMLRNAVLFPGEQGPRRILKALLPPHETAYALTIHKSQGSEYEQVALILPDRDHELLTKELIYTAVTRAKKHVAIYGSAALFIAGAARKTERMSGLEEQLSGIHTDRQFLS